MWSWIRCSEVRGSDIATARTSAAVTTSAPGDQCVGDQGLVRLVGDLEDRVGVLDRAEPGVAELLCAAAPDSGDVVARPPVPDMLAVTLELGDQGPDIGVVRVPGGGQPEAAEHGPGLRLPLQVDLSGLVRSEHPAHQVALTRGPCRPVTE